MSDKTICWRCNRQYFFEDEKCFECDAPNPNVDFEGAEAEMLREEQEQNRIRREYAAEGMER